MTEDLMNAMQAVGAEFMPAEHSVDLAAARVARLLAVVLEQRSAANLSIGTGASLIRKLSRSLSAQIDAREEFLLAHKLAATLPAELGITPVAYGDTVPCPPDDPKRALFGGADNIVRLAAA